MTRRHAIRQSEHRARIRRAAFLEVAGVMLILAVGLFCVALLVLVG